MAELNIEDYQSSYSKTIKSVEASTAAGYINVVFEDESVLFATPDPTR